MKKSTIMSVYGNPIACKHLSSWLFWTSSQPQKGDTNKIQKYRSLCWRFLGWPDSRKEPGNYNFWSWFIFLCFLPFGPADCLLCVLFPLLMELALSAGLTLKFILLCAIPHCLYVTHWSLNSTGIFNYLWSKADYLSIGSGQEK